MMIEKQELFHTKSKICTNVGKNHRGLYDSGIFNIDYM